MLLEPTSLQSQQQRFDYSDSAFSPPADDTFFLIRYPKPAPSTAATDVNKEGFRSISDFLAGKRETSTTSTTSSGGSQQLTSFGADKIVSEPKLIIANKPKINKPTISSSSSSDDFNGDKAAEAGRSIVTVASQIMFGKSTLSSVSEATTQQQLSCQASSQKEQMKTVSKSLPATPLASPSGTPDSSPKSRRRAYGNRFFTGAFVPDGEQRQKNGWLLGSILGQSRELVASRIVEEDDELPAEQVPARALSRKKSISSQNLTYLGKEDSKPAPATTSQILQAQPSELREMNFWSPTSM